MSAGNRPTGRELSDGERIAALESRVAALESAKASPSKSTGEVASDHDLDGKFGNEPIRRDPSSKYWPGPSHVGDRMSDCPAEYLDALAKYKDACAHMNEKSGDASKAKYIEYDRRDAARARGWAARIRSGKVVQAPADPFGLRTPDTRYSGTSGHGGVAKHTGTPEPADAGFDDFAGDTGGDPEIPFARVGGVMPRHLRRRSLWIRF